MRRRRASTCSRHRRSTRESVIVMSGRRRTEDGASAVEYGLLVAAIAGLLAIIVFAIGGSTTASFTDTCEKLKTGLAAAGPCE